MVTYQHKLMTQGAPRYILQTKRVNGMLVYVHESYRVFGLICILNPIHGPKDPKGPPLWTKCPFNAGRILSWPRHEHLEAFMINDIPFRPETVYATASPSNNANNPARSRKRSRGEDHPRRLNYQGSPYIPPPPRSELGTQGLSEVPHFQHADSDPGTSHHFKLSMNSSIYETSI